MDFDDLIKKLENSMEKNRKNNPTRLALKKELHLYREKIQELKERVFVNPNMIISGEDCPESQNYYDLKERLVDEKFIVYFENKIKEIEKELIRIDKYSSKNIFKEEA